MKRNLTNYGLKLVKLSKMPRTSFNVEKFPAGFLLKCFQIMFSP